MKYSLVASLIAQSSVVLGELIPMHFKAPTPAHFQDIVRNDTFDFGCHPAALPTDEGHYKLRALLTQAQIDFVTKEYASSGITVHRSLTRRQAASAAVPIGSGDRFTAGTKLPVGLGTQSSTARINSILNLNEIKSGVQALVNTYGIGYQELSSKTFEGRTQYIFYAGAGTDKSKYHIYFSAGIHARERGGPDNILYFMADLLAADKAGTGLTYGRKSYTNAQVKSVLQAGIVVFPAVNPDGIAYDQSTDSLWRKNRNTRSGSGSSTGVDLNRNFDFLWDFPKKFASSTSPASTSPGSQTFYGTAPFSEPETKNHASVYDSFPKIRWMVDIHSAVGDVLYSWGDDENQSTTPTQNFLNTAFDGRRGVIGDSSYKEYIPAQDLTNARSAAAAMTNGLKAPGGRSYGYQQAVGLYATSGATDDYAFSRFWAKPGVNKVYGYTLEFAPTGNFYPASLTEFNNNILDTNAGFMDFALEAIRIGLE
ncbi:Zn-dependent exopeptidase [Periconia macrospinosa]|uniref:Zn-dependent exopeptidase n=1 Tax=Periconia macrospinosa TaxID=97972 RepID=A0A2V1E0A7_9PLEO|nr:Zn-dependent exopeptidase [Periconia macrospinosa]